MSHGYATTPECGRCGAANEDLPEEAGDWSPLLGLRGLRRVRVLPVP